MSVIEAKLNDSLVKVVQSCQEKRYSDAIESLNKLFSPMDQWFHAEPEVHRMYFRTYYRVLKACLYGDLGLYYWLNNDHLSATRALKQSVQMLPIHLSLQRLSYLAILRNDSDAAISHLLCLVSDPLLNYNKIAPCKCTCASHPSEALALRAATTAYYGNIVEGINLISLALSYHSQTAAEIATPMICAQLRAGIAPRVIARMPSSVDMSPAELRKYHLLLRVFVSLCKIAVDKCVKLPIVVNCDIRNILNHVFGEFHKLVISNVIFDPTGLYQVLLDKYLSIGGNPSAVKVYIENKEYLLDLYSFAFPWIWNPQTAIRSFTGIMKENAFTDTVWTLLSAYDKKASRRAVEAGMYTLSRKKTVEETALAEYVYNMHGLQITPLFADRAHSRSCVDFAKISRAGPGDAVKSVVNARPSASEAALHALTHRTRSVSEDSFDSCVTETKESLMKAFQEAVQSRKSHGTPNHISVAKSPTITAAPIRVMDLSGLHVCPSPAELASSLVDTVIGQPIAPLDTLWTKHASTCQECKDPKPTYQARKIVDETDLKACIDGHQTIIKQIENGAPYSAGLSGIYNGEVERVKNTSVLSRFMLGSTIRAMNEGSGGPLKPFSKRCRQLAKALQTTTQDYDLDTPSEKSNVKSNLIDTVDLSTEDLVPSFRTFNPQKKKIAERRAISTTRIKTIRRRENLSKPLTPVLRPQSTPICTAQTSSTKHVQRTTNQAVKIVKATAGLAEAKKPVSEISTTILPKQNLLTGKIVLDYISNKDTLQVESDYINIGLVTAILDRDGSVPATEPRNSASSIKGTGKRTAAGTKDHSVVGMNLLQDRGLCPPVYLNAVTYQAEFTPHGAADTIEASSSAHQLSLPEQVDLFQYCDTKPNEVAECSIAVSGYTERCNHSAYYRGSAASSEVVTATLIDQRHRLRPYSAALEKYVVESLPQTPPRSIPKLMSNIQPSPRDILDREDKRKTVSIHQVAPTNNLPLSHFTGKTMSALLVRPRGVQK